MVNILQKTLGWGSLATAAFLGAFLLGKLDEGLEKEGFYPSMWKLQPNVDTLNQM